MALALGCAPSGSPVDDGGAGRDAPSNAPDAAPNTTCDPGVANPTPEVCDSIDNDCNGLIDDGLFMPNPEACGLLACYFGNWVEYGDDVGTVGEICNNHDDDCDELVDEDLTRPDPNNSCKQQRCVNGTWVDDTPPSGDEDDCDGIDNDCDGLIDEDFDPGICMATCGGLPTFGTEQCIDGEVVCQPDDFPISFEICNCEDDDCDELVDEGIEPRPCPCGDAYEQCVSCEWTGCTDFCVIGTERWCDDPQYCYWGKQECVADPDGVGRWGTCEETTERPDGCTGDVYDPDCCVAAGECCQDAFDSWLSVGDCGEQCP